jgi:hypothetical protein
MSSTEAINPAAVLFRLAVPAFHMVMYFILRLYLFRPPDSTYVASW